MGLQSVEVRVLWVRETAALRACCRGSQNKDEDVFRNPLLLPQAWERLRDSFRIVFQKARLAKVCVA